MLNSEQASCYTLCNIDVYVFEFSWAVDYVELFFQHASVSDNSMVNFHKRS